MKKTFKFCTIAALFAAGFIGCSSEEVGPDKGTITEAGEGVEGYANLVVKDASPSTYGATNIDGASEEEKLTDAATIGKYVYKATNGAFEKTDDVTFTQDATGIFVSQEFKLMSGNKFIYVIADQKKTTTIDKKNQRVDFEKQIVDANFTASTAANDTCWYGAGTAKRVVGNPNNIASDGKFFIATLWGKSINAPAGGKQGSPVALPSMKIGRLAAKVKLKSVLEGAGGGVLGGHFDVTPANVTYRLCSVPNDMYLIGQWSGIGDYVPGTLGQNGISVYSNHHEDEWGTMGADGWPIQNPAYMNYTWDKAKTAGQIYYTVENTTVINQQTKDQYYGNTTYMQMKILYKPSLTETHNADGSPAAAEVTGTFYTATVDGATLIFNAKPNDDVKKIDKNSVKEYTDGYMYYSFPIQDPNESTVELKNAIIRNHSYIVNVLNIKNFGDNVGSEVIPNKPIEQETWVKIEVETLPWSEITQGVEL